MIHSVIAGFWARDFAVRRARRPRRERINIWARLYDPSSGFASERHVARDRHSAACRRWLAGRDLVGRYRTVLRSRRRRWMCSSATLSSRHDADARARLSYRCSHCSTPPASRTRNQAARYASAHAVHTDGAANGSVSHARSPKRRDRTRSASSNAASFTAGWWRELGSGVRTEWRRTSCWPPTARERRPKWACDHPRTRMRGRFKTCAPTVP